MARYTQSVGVPSTENRWGAELASQRKGREREMAWLAADCSLSGATCPQFAERIESLHQSLQPSAGNPIVVGYQLLSQRPSHQFLCQAPGIGLMSGDAFCYLFQSPTLAFKAFQGSRKQGDRAE